MSGPMGNGAIASLSDVEPEAFKQLLLACVKAGVAVTIGSTRDGSTVTVALLDGGQVHKAYASDAAELETIIETICLQAEVVS